jgi:serine/threonine-protein kinase
VELPADTRISHYRILSRLGAGGMGEVYLAEDTRLDRKVAIKVLPGETLADDQAKKRLVREAQAAAKLDHSNICSIHEVGEDAGRDFIVMQYVEGETLARRVQHKPLELHESLDIAVQVADALTEAHSHGIIHRDIKPANIMLTPRGQVKVMDFGLAKLVGQQTTGSQDLTQGILTEPGTIVGTVPYMSPEQVRGEPVDARSDIFSFGAVLYEMVSGRQPFLSESAAATTAAILTREPPPLARYSKEVPAELQRIVSKAVCKDREKRYQVVKDLGLDLKSLKEELIYEAKSRTADQPESGETAAGARKGNQGLDTGKLAGTPSNKISPARTSSSAEYVINEIKRHKRAVLLALPVVVSAAIGLGLYFHARNTELAIESIAVLPFINASADPDAEYLSDGMTDSLIYSLSRLPNLKVKSHSSVFRYKGKEVEPQTPGRELGVQAVLTGRIVQRGEMLVINAELVEVGSNNVLWGQQYNRKLSEIQSVQDEMSKGVSEKLRLKLTGEEQQRLTRHYTALPEAYQAYLRGQYYSNYTAVESEGKAIGYFNQAIGLDPNYAQAYAGLAAVYADISSVSLPPSEAMPKAKEAVLKALSLDASLAEAHLSLAVIHWWADWDFPAAEREFKRAIELSPNEPTTYSGFGGFLSRMPGRFDEAIAAANHALQLDSFSVTANIGAVIVFYNTHHYDQAIEQAGRTLEINRDLAVARYFLGAAYLEKGQSEQAISELQKNRSRPVALGLLGYAYAAAGRKAEARKALAELQAISGRRFVSPYEIARIYVGLGEKEQAFEWLEKAYQGRSDLLTRLQVDPTLDSLRSDPRFAHLVRRVGLEKH